MAQYDKKKVREIEREGRKLYRSEAASWRATDALTAHFAHRIPHIGGYLSYDDGPGVRSIFISKTAVPRVLLTFTLDGQASLESLQTDSVSRPLTAAELALLQLRQAAVAVLEADTAIQFPANTRPNIIPIQDAAGSRVYVLTGPQENNVMLIGNDYCLTFNQQSKLTSSKRLHQNLLPIYFGDRSPANTTASIHSHSPRTGDYITPTDICTLLLYERRTSWQQHYVVSARLVNIWGCERNELTILTRKVWDKLGKHHK